MSISIPDLLEGILEATAAEAAAKARIVAYRGALEDEARRRLAADGAAPSWNAPELGKVRLEPAGAWSATVADPAAFGSYVAEHHPTEATAVLALSAGDLEAALEALEFAGIKPLDTNLEVRSAWSGPFLASLALDVDEEELDDGTVNRTVTAADTTTGSIVPGIDVTRSAAKLVVSLDRGRRTAVVEEARTSANAAIADAIGEDQAAADLAALDVTRRELEGLHGDQLATIAKAHGLGSSGTKAALAERIARAEHATGKVVRPAATLEGTVHRAISEEAVVGVVAQEPPPTDRVATTGHRIPYVGDGADGARRSAAIDSSEADGMDPGEARDERLAIDLGVAIAVVLGDEELTRLTAVDPIVAAAKAQADQPLTDLEAAGSREVLRAAAKARSISAAGTKRDVALRLLEAGVTAEDLTR